MRVKDAFDVLRQSQPPDGVRFDRVGASTTNLNFTLQVPSKERNYVYFFNNLLRVIFVISLFYAGYLIGEKDTLFVILLWMVAAFFGEKIWHRLRKEGRASYYTHLGLELSPKGGIVHKYYKGKKGKLTVSFKWFEVNGVLIKKTPPLLNKEAKYYLQLTSKNVSDVDLFKSGITTVQADYLASLLTALLQQRKKGRVPENWQETFPIVEQPIWIDLSDHLIE